MGIVMWLVVRWRTRQAEGARSRGPTLRHDGRLGRTARNARLKLSRLFQPKNPQFWLLVALNLLSAAISWLLQNREFPLAIMLALATFALANFWLGLRIALRLMKEPPGPK